MNQDIVGPVKEIPNHLINGYTMGGNITIEYEYNFTHPFSGYMNHTKGKDFTWSKEYIKSFCDKLNIEDIKKNKYNMNTPYGAIALEGLIKAFDKYKITNKRVAVVGSETPWIEAVLINLNNKVTTVDYNVPKTNFDNLSIIDIDEFYNLREEFDCIVTYSSIEHSGLGRYGDLLDPNADIKSMNNIHKALKPSGLCIWGAPVRTDAVVWNAHRVYGAKRLPLLFQGFSEEDWFMYTKEELYAYGPFKEKEVRTAPQPVVVLKKQ